MDILNFSDKPVKDVIIIQPTGKVRGYVPLIEQPGAKGRFYLTIGCQSSWIDKTMIKDMILELDGDVLKTAQEVVKVIHKKGTTATAKSARLMDITDLYFITSTSKACLKTDYDCSTITRDVKSKYFHKKAHGSIYYKNDYQLYLSDRKVLKSIFKIMHDYYFPGADNKPED